ncbi:MAG: general secretion pathway protein GspK [bacterium]
MRKNDSGLALIIVLWLLALVSVIIAQFAFSMKVETEVTRNYKDQIIAYHLAKAGFHLAVMEMMNPTVNSTSTSGEKVVFGHRKQENDQDTGEEEIPVNREKIRLGKGFFSYRIIDEEGKLDLNFLSNPGRKTILSKLLEVSAGLAGEELEEIIDSIYDWCDKDDNYRPNGAEDDYYQGLDPPYHCKNGPFDTIYDLLLIKGVTPEIFYGNDDSGETYEGLERNLTVWSEGVLNEYSASFTVLTAQNGGEEKAEKKKQKMFDEEGKPIDNKHRSSHFSIISTGYCADGSSRRSILAVVKSAGVGTANPWYEIKYWNDNYIPSETRKSGQ